MDNIVLTEKGLALRDKLNAGQTTASFTRFCTSSAEYDQSELGALTELKDSKLESAVTNLEIREDHTMVISGAVDNKSLQEGYYITLIGLYAKETDGEEILFAVSKVSSPMYMPEKSGALSGMSIRFSVKIENADSVNVTVDPTTAATLGDLNALKKEVLTPAFEDYEAEEAPALPSLEDAMKQIKSGNTMRVILQNTKAALKGLLNLVNAKVNQKDYDATISKLNGDITGISNRLGRSNIAPNGYSSFSEIPLTAGLVSCNVYGTGIADGPAPNNGEPQWWDVLQFGIETRLARIAIQAYRGFPSSNNVFVQMRHDSGWGSWIGLHGWNYLGELKPGQTLALPGTFSEVMILGYRIAEGSIHYTVGPLPYQTLKDSRQTYFGGHYRTAGSNASMAVSVSKTQIVHYGLVVNGVEDANSTYEIYWK